MIPGVAQGSVIGSLSFLTYINAIPTCIDQSVRLLADDCVIYSRINNPNDHVILQWELDKRGTWCSRWLMKMNTLKCKQMSATSKTYISITNYCLLSYSYNIEIVPFYKYLGAHISETLNWSHHTNHKRKQNSGSSKTQSLMCAQID